MLYHKRFGFTLAEVLITLGIIGIVAAIIIPSLVQKINDKQNIAMWKKKASEITSVYNLVKEEMSGEDICVFTETGDFRERTKCKTIYGDSSTTSLTYTTLSPEFVDKFVSHLEVIDSCGRPQYGETEMCNQYYFNWYGACGNSNTGYYGTLTENKGSQPWPRPTSCSPASGLYTGWDFMNKAVLLKDGSVIYFGGYATGWISVDVNSFSRGPNVLGRDFFTLMLNDSWIKPLGADGTFSKSANGAEKCECSRTAGAESGQGFLGQSDLLHGMPLSGGCCSAYYLYAK